MNQMKYVILKKISRKILKNNCFKQNFYYLLSFFTVMTFFLKLLDLFFVKRIKEF